MASQNPQEITPSPALWDAGDVPIQIPEDCTWGIPKEMIPDVWRLLDSRPEASEKRSFSLEDFQRLISLLYLNRSDRVPLGKAIAEEVAALDQRGGQNPLPEKIRPFNGHWIMIAGTSSNALPNEQRWIAEVMADLLAREGYGLVCGGWSGVDEIISREYNSVLRNDNLDVSTRLKMFITNQETPTYRHGQVFIVRDFEEWKTTAVGTASAVVLIGGRSRTYSIYEAARDQNIPVIPIKASGGDADIAFREMANGEGAVAYRNRLVNQIEKINAREDALIAARQVLDMLRELLGSVPSITKDQFMKAAQEEEGRRKVVFVDDIQRGRWGRSSESHGYLLDAGSRLSSDGDVMVILTIRRVEGIPPVSGWVVIYYQVERSRQQLKVSEFRNSEATIEISLDHACTVGAYLQDATVLELDLNLIKGAPDWFYHASPPDVFRELVSEAYRKNKVKVKNDIQKNRWGGKNVNSGKQLRARVTKGRYSGQFVVTLEVLGQSQRQPLTGWVAFFVPFVPEIFYWPAEGTNKKGIVAITVDATEAFTAGAMTEDGILLELDLQEVTGFPSEFYYEKRKPKIDRPNPKKSPRPKKK